MGFDFGLKKTGVAVGQMLTKTTTPIGILKVKQGHPNWDEVSALIAKWQPSALVVGIPVNQDGSDMHHSELARKFVRQLHGRYQIEVHTIDETLSTREAYARLEEMGHQRLGSKQVDDLSACLILESWMASH